MTQHIIERLATLANGDPWLTHRGRFLDVAFLLEVGDTEYLISIREGGVESVERGPLVQPRWRFAMRASAEDWGRFWSASPQPGFHDLIAMMKFKRLRLEGDLYPFMTHIRYFKDLLAIPRAGAAP
jgi:hypothetical protein